MFGPVLEGEKGVRLAPVREEMLLAITGWFADLEVTQYLGNVYPPTLPMEKEWFERVAKSDKDVLWGSFVGEKLIGVTGIHGIDWANQKASTGNLIGEKSEWRKGYATEIIRLRTEWAFMNMNLQKLTTQVYTENVGSRRALEKNGYVTYGIARREIFRQGRWYDAWLGECLREEWLATVKGVTDAQ